MKVTKKVFTDRRCNLDTMPDGAEFRFLGSGQRCGLHKNITKKQSESTI